MTYSGLQTCGPLFFWLHAHCCGSTSFLALPSPRLDYVPGVFQVQRHIRGVWAFKCCQHLRQEAMPAQIIDAGIPTARLLAQVLISKYDDHLPLYRQNEIYARSGVDLSRSTLGDWVGDCGVALAPVAQALKEQLLRAGVLHADESPITILGGNGGQKARLHLGLCLRRA